LASWKKFRVSEEETRKTWEANDSGPFTWMASVGGFGLGETSDDGKLVSEMDTEILGLGMGVE